MIFCSIVIPVYNSEKTIEKLVDDIISLISGKYTFEIVLINDSSTDNSNSICKKIFNTHIGFIKYISLSKNVGEHSAVMAGLNYSNGDYVIIMDDDFQNPVSEIEKLINAICSQQKDVVYSQFLIKNHSIIRNFYSKLNDKITCILLKKPKKLYLSSFKIMNRFLVNEIIKYDLPYPYIDGLILRTTDSIGTVNVKHNKRISGKSGYNLSKLLSLWSNMFLNFSLLPLRIVTLIGFYTALVAFLIGIYTIIEKFTNPELPAGYSMIIITISFFSGLLLIGIGVLGEYIGRIFLSLGKKPQFTVREKYIPDGNK